MKIQVKNADSNPKKRLIVSKDTSQTISCLIFVSDDFDDLASDNSFLPDRIQRDYQLLSEFQTKQLRQPTHLFRGLQVR